MIAVTVLKQSFVHYRCVCVDKTITWSFQPYHMVLISKLIIPSCYLLAVGVQTVSTSNVELCVDEKSHFEKQD